MLWLSRHETKSLAHHRVSESPLLKILAFCQILGALEGEEEEAATMLGGHLVGVALEGVHEAKGEEMAVVAIGRHSWTSP